MDFTKIDLNTWDRKYYYDYFMDEKNKMRCRVGMTAQVDITKLLKEIKRKKLRCYLTFTYLISKALNNHDEFKVSKYNGDLVIWDELNVRYPMFNVENKTVTSIWLKYSDNFEKFYNNAIEDIEQYSGIKSMYAKENFPPNFFDITSIPWVSFTDFQIDMYGIDGSWLGPFVAIGKFFEQGEKVLLPVHIKVHHAMCDGYHIGLFFNELQSLCENIENWM